MRKRRGLKRLGDAIAPASYWFLTLGGACFVALSKAKKSQGQEGLQAVYNWAVTLASEHKDWVVPAIACSLAVIGPLLKSKGLSRVDGVVKKLLNKFREESFPGGVPYVTHRVTLFKHHNWYFGRFGVGTIWNAVFSKRERWRWPWSGWLVAYERAGDFHLDSKARFLAPLGEVEKAEGFAGRLLREKLAFKIEDLPDITDKSNANDKQRWLEMAEVNTAYLEEKLKLRRPLPRSFWGTYIEVDSTCWGVLVVDSRSSTLPTSKQLEKNFAPTGTCLSQLLSKKTS